MIAVFLLASGAALAGAEPSTLPTWMTGCWLSQNGTQWSEECWSPERGGVMMGTNVSGDTGKPRVPAGWETMQIARDNGRLVFRASPRGSERTTFRATVAKGSEVTFVNTGHDYPQRIRYWRDADTLRAQISLADGSKAVNWIFSRAAR
ncbi:DUF6265 family protein [Novosphingobium sp. Leaf2]|uniref:DUF6265 family protein n=1 Tax=Novosphingobium sp. Leaf2 TaxID=1735670 RepID=UPI0006F82D69|nr:DUF6265 family protein [Novosphingobium sp. Leaf2]KQM17309.1 hypothetical protein ASE49_09560 [Novosphingobium sp. Leaf2]